MLNAVTEGCEADFGVVGEVERDLILIQPTTVAILEALGKIPVVQSLWGNM